MLSALTFVHRWVGVILALFMLVWFSTGLVIAFVGASGVTREQQLAHAASLSPEAGWLSLGEALQTSAAARKAAAKAEEPGGGMGGRVGGGEHAGRAHGEAAIADARLARVGGAPVWLVEDDRGRRFALSARDGALINFSVEQAQQIARAWLGAASLIYLDTVDAPVGVRNAETLKPFHRFALGDDAGTRMVVSARTGEVVQVATRVERGFAYVGNWLHLFRWLDALGAGEYRRDALTWAGFFAGSGALTGLVLGWIRWRPGFFGRPTYLGGRSQPYRAFWFKYHFWAGFIGGTFAALWATSGYLSTNPFQIFSQATASREELARYRGASLPALVADWKPSAALGAGSEIVEANWGRLGDDAVLIGVARDGARRALNIEGAKTSFAREDLLAAAQRLAGDRKIAGQEELAAYDDYYYPNRRQSVVDKPLPVLRVDLADASRTSLYIDPTDGRLLATFDASRRAYRWLYTAIHHWDFGWFENRWLWNCWMALWIAFGVALSATALVLAWRRLKRTFGEAFPKFALKKTRALEPG